VRGSKGDDANRPAKAGWYPDPWSADGRGERYFDGKKWGTSERPLAREATVTKLTGRRGARRRMRQLGPVLVFLTAVLAVWGIGQLRESGHHGSSIISSPPVTQNASPAPDSTTATTESTSTTERTYVHREYTVGECVIWDSSRPGPVETRVVSCDQPHFVQIVVGVDLAARLHHYPTTAESRMLFLSDCKQGASKVVGHALTASANYDLGGFLPTPKAYDQGDRILWCWARKSKSSERRMTPVVGRLT